MLLMTSSVFAQHKMVKQLETELGSELTLVDPDYSKKIDSSELEIVWSRTVDSVIVGYSYKYEYIAEIDTEEREAILYPTFITNLISKEDFFAFRTWILDSLARDQIYFGLKSTDDQIEWVSLSKQDKKRYKEFKKNPNFSLHGRNASFYPENLIQNQAKAVNYSDPNLIPILMDLYLPEPERFRGKQTFDFRKISYEMQLGRDSCKGRIPVIVDSYQWAQNSTHPFDVGALISYLDDKILLEAPISSINPGMTQVYCHWKEQQLKKQLPHANYSIRCRLPTVLEAENHPMAAPQIILDSYDYTKNWQITNAEFNEFVQAALDSVCREYLFFHEKNEVLANSLLAYRNHYYSSSDLEYVEFNPVTRQLNRELFPWNSKRIRWTKFGFESQNTLVDSMNLQKVDFYYEWMAALNRSTRGELYRVPKPTAINSPWRMDLEVRKINGFNEPNGQDLGIEGYFYFKTEDSISYGQGTRTHANLQRFHVFEVVSVPLPSEVPLDDEIADITYEQALAYYNWNYRIDLYNEGDDGDWQQFVFPSQEEFERIKNGASIVYPAQEIQYDFPVFRMVVELQPKN